MANILLNQNETFNVGSNANSSVFGQTGTEKVIVETGATGLFVDQNIERVDLSANSNDYIYQQQGNRILVFIDGALVATIPVQGDADGTQIVFANGSVFVTLAAGIINFGGATVPSTIADTVTPITIDTSVTTMAIPDPRNSLISPVELSAIEQNTNNSGFVINGVDEYDQSGLSVSNAGDVNGDGFDDLIVGAWTDDPNGLSSGASFVVFGKTDGTTVELATVQQNTNDSGFVINGASADDRSGRSVSNAGDVNGDGLADLIVGANRDDPNGSYSGASFVVFGKTNGIAVELSEIEQNANNGGFVINGSSEYDHSGVSVSSAGDVNGDGLDDLIVGAWGDDPNGAYSGASFVVFGKANGGVVELSTVEQNSSNSGFVINGADTYDQSGVYVSSTGDVNGDGLDDLIVGAWGDDPNGNYSGSSFVVFGKTSGTTVELSAIEQNSNNNGFVINGASTLNVSGYSVSDAGDVNGDGFNDLIIGAPLASPNGTYSGASFVVFGKTDGAAIDLAAVASGTGGFVVNGISEGDQSGFSVSSAGDVNSDGFDDLIIGAFPGLVVGGSGAISGTLANDPSGTSFVVFGKTDSTAVELSAVENDAGGFVINAVNASDNIRSVSGSGDVNGDGFADLIVGAHGDDPNDNIRSGASFVIFGGQGSSATVGSNGADTLTGDGNANQLVAGIGDDILLGNGGADVLRGGAGNDILAISDLNFMSLDGGGGIDTLRFDATLAADLSSIANNRLISLEVIDLNATSSSLVLTTDDILTIVGDEAANDLRINGSSNDNLNLSNTSFFNSGATITIDSIIYVIYQPFAGLNLDASVRLLVQQGINVSDAGIKPIELSAIEQNTNNSGFVINGVDEYDQSGISVSNAGDVNGDGFDDLIVGAWDDDPGGLSSGAGFVVFGKTDGMTVELATVQQNTNDSGFVINGSSAGDRSGRSVSNAGDVNGDGLADLIVGANRDDPNGSYSGASFVVFGKTNGIAVELSEIEQNANNGGFVINGSNEYDHSGVSVSSAGDVNGDGLDDLIVGAWGDDPNGTYSGASFVVFGKANGDVVELSTVEQNINNSGFVINGIDTYDQSGVSVSSAGDVNGDGLDDLIVGAWGDDPNGTYSGASFVVFGKTGGTTVELSAIEQNSNNNGFVINGASTLNVSGYSVSDAGDVNGDGFNDLIIGAPLASPNGTYSGASFVVFGKTDGAAIDLAAVASGTGGFVVNGASEGDQSGFSVSSAGDVNSDGFDDLIIGAFPGLVVGGSGAISGTLAKDSSGTSFVVFGKTDSTAVELSVIENGTGGFAINAVNASDNIRSVSGAGDVNNDGFDDFIVGAFSANPNGNSSGASFVIFGGQGSSAVTSSNTDAVNNDIVVIGAATSNIDVPII